MDVWIETVLVWIGFAGIAAGVLMPISLWFVRLNHNAGSDNGDNLMPVTNWGLARAAITVT